MKSSSQPLSRQGASRRRLLTGWLQRSQALSEPVAAVLPLPRVARPPQSLPEILFNATCNGCGECVNRCPYGLLSVEQDQVVLNIDFTECDFCLKCTAACQTGALRNIMPCDTLLRPQISQSCLGRQDSCQMCVINCPQQALAFQLDDRGVRQLQYDDACCNGCGMCKLSCFHGHIMLIPTGEKCLPE
ncbi:ferredoxin-type protein NapF [Serratia sp. DD3]|uniref:ferredoxin-type protein NapF n=1 Tax=Serratia sp. DD3 TaxID=1410619 RepID=UPI0003C4F9E6|nr:ferredoxin-type protein NapF [Serratia sp. DD3]KEY58213.1 ferredoxin-type protein [Serratia sp. DD3]